jgi:predicted membrane protein
MNTAATTINPNASDYLNTTAVFGEVKKTIVSRDFKGGKVSSLFGETTLDFTDADISGVAELDISQAFGEITLIVPMNWRIEPDMSQFLAATRDKRGDVAQSERTDKVLVITGNSAFAALTILNSI